MIQSNKKENPFPSKIEGLGELKCRRHFFMDNPDENVVPNTFKKNDLYETFMKYISNIRERNDRTKDGAYWSARNEMIKALFNLSPQNE